MAKSETTSGVATGIGDESLIAGGVSVKAYAATYQDVEFFLGNDPDHPSSGDTELALGDVGPGANVTRAHVLVRGEAYRGKVRNFRGTRVTPSPLVYDENGAAAPSVPNQRAFVIDFGGVRTLLGMSVPGSKAKIVLVLPWMGTDFGSKPAYPVIGSLPFYAFPEPDPDGKASVGFPAIETAKLFVQIRGNGIADAAQFADEVRIVTGVMPTNVRASVNGRPVFFTRPNALDREAELTGLAEELNAIAGEAQETVAASLKIATDTPGAIVVTYSAATDFEIERSATARWGGRDALDLPLAGLMPAPLELVFPTDDTAAWKVRRIVLELGGSFPPWRAFGPVGMPAAKLALKASAQFSVARRFSLPGRTVLHGIALPLRLPSGHAEVRLEIAADVDGAPAESKPLATVDLVLDASDGGATWYDALVATPIDTGDARATLGGGQGQERGRRVGCAERALANAARDPLHERGRTLAALSGAGGRSSGAAHARVARADRARECAAPDARARYRADGIGRAQRRSVGRRPRGDRVRVVRGGGRDRDARRRRRRDRRHCHSGGDGNARRAQRYRLLQDLTPCLAGRALDDFGRPIVVDELRRRRSLRVAAERIGSERRR